MISRRKKNNVALAAAGRQIVAALRHRCSECQEHCEGEIGGGEEGNNNGFGGTKGMCVPGEGRKW